LHILSALDVAKPETKSSPEEMQNEDSKYLNFIGVGYE